MTGLAEATTQLFAYYGWLRSLGLFLAMTVAVTLICRLASGDTHERGQWLSTLIVAPAPAILVVGVIWSSALFMGIGTPIHPGLRILGGAVDTPRVCVAPERHRGQGSSTEAVHNRAAGACRALAHASRAGLVMC